ncbi:hypothetical protein Cgig2_002029 [Carnegiea gigantea]|uniref:Uncharacterized protein n=1 Tax=Carnegiea gigantea TaxID=171969 RepID=A0A9Q1GHJ9_9CARY|nr:hypothetical protein Cgig2_002029 [Carnegiea gigantea]
MPLSLLIMAFPPLYDTRETADYMRESFIWHWRRATRPPCPLPEDYHVLCPHFSLPEAERAAADFELPKMVCATFYATLLNEAVELGVVRSFIVEGLKSFLMGLRLTMDYMIWAMRQLDWGPLEVWLGDNVRRLQKAQATQPANSLASLVLVDNPSRGRTTSFPAFWDIVHATEYVRDNLRWSVRESSSLRSNLLPLHFMAYYFEFDHIVVMQFAHAIHIPQMMQAIFYAMVINDAVELRLIKKETRESLMLDLQELRWDIIEAWLLSIEDKLKDAQVPRLVETVYNPRPHPVVTSRLRDAPPLSSDEEDKWQRQSPPPTSGLQTSCWLRVRKVIPVPLQAHLNQRPRWPPLVLALPRGEHPPPLLMDHRDIRPRGSINDHLVPRSVFFPGKSVPKKKGRYPVEPVLKIVMEGPEFLGAPARLDP